VNNVFEDVVRKSETRKTSATSAETREQPARRARLLVVEDSESSRAMVCDHLREENFEFEEAENGAIAVERARATRYDLILMDIMMPMMDGYEAIRRIRQWEESHGFARTPIIAFTGSSFEEDVQRALASGANLHVSKPIRKEALVEAIQSLIRRDIAGAASGKHSV
jgi:CheY-like chemotaxis protein